MKEEKQTLIEMLVGLLISTVIVGVLGVILAGNKLAYILGVVAGSVIALIALLQMYYTLSKAVEMEGKRATRYSVTASIIRMALMAASLVVGILWPDYFNVVGVLLGLLSLKLCAFIQPFIHRVLVS